MLDQETFDNTEYLMRLENDGAAKFFQDNDYYSAIKVLTNGYRKGNYYCLCVLARMFLAEGNLELAARCWKEFFQFRRMFPIHDMEALGKFELACVSYLLFYKTTGKVNIDWIADMIPHADKIIPLIEELEGEAYGSLGTLVNEIFYRVSRPERRNLFISQIA